VNGLAVTAALAFVACAVLGSAVTGRFIAWLWSRRVLDTPNERSLHAVEVPRGAGLPMALLGLAAHLGFALAGQPPGGLVAVAGAVLLTALGWRDDRGSLPAGRRLLAQLAVAAVVASAVVPATVPVAGVALLAVALAWHVNLFNFMDGADGFAASHALLVCLGLGLLLLDGAAAGAAWAFALAGAVLGFLRWNWPPAHAFMGDAGSYFLGFELALLGVVAWRAGVAPAAVFILLAPFVVDASLTLVRRALAGRVVWRAHREHLYQRLLLAGLTPRGLLGRLYLLHLALCWPLALIANRVPSGAWLAGGLYGVLAMIWLWMGRSQRR